jgi:excisionase family DNA binding protein
MEITIITKEELKAFDQKLDEIWSMLENMKPVSDKTRINWVDNADLKQMLKVSTRTIQKWRDDGTIPFSKVGSKIYYRLEDVEALLKRNYYSYNSSVRND